MAIVGAAKGGCPSLIIAMDTAPISKRNIQSGQEKGFLWLTERLREQVLRHIRSGGTTERGLAHLTAISQPHLHNVLCGARSLTPAVGDLLLRTLGIDLSDLIDADSRPSGVIPFLDGPLGGGCPFPALTRTGMDFPLVHAGMAQPRQPAVAEVKADPCSRDTFRTGDLVLVDLHPGARLRFPPGAWLAVLGDQGVFLRRVWRSAGGLWCAGDDARQRTWIPLSGSDQLILEVLGARVVWIGRTLEPAAALDGAPQETGTEY